MRTKFTDRDQLRVENYLPYHSTTPTTLPPLLLYPTTPLHHSTYYSMLLLHTTTLPHHPYCCYTTYYPILSLYHPTTSSPGILEVHTTTNHLRVVQVNPYRLHTTNQHLGVIQVDPHRVYSKSKESNDWSPICILPLQYKISSGVQSYKILSG